MKKSLPAHLVTTTIAGPVATMKTGRNQLVVLITTTAAAAAATARTTTNVPSRLTPPLTRLWAPKTPP